MSTEEIPEVSNMEEVLDEYEQSSVMFSHGTKLLRGKLRVLAERKKKAPVRILESLILAPLEDAEVFGKEEQEILDLCQALMYHKNKIVEYTMLRKNEQETKEGNKDEWN